MRSHLLRGITIAAAVLAAACTASDAVAPNSATAPRAATAARTADAAPDSAATSDGAVVGSAWRSLDGVQWIPCAANGAGEYVSTTGQIRYRAHRTQDANGIYHLNINSNTSQLTGVGATTGDTYRGSETERVTARAEGYYGSQSLRIAENVHYVAIGGGANFTIQYDTHVEVDQNGTIVLWVEGQRVSCN